MGLIEAPKDGGEKRRLSAGKNDDVVRDAEVEDGDADGNAEIPEAELLSEFDRLGKNAEN